MEDPLSLKILRLSRRKLRKSEWRHPTLGKEQSKGGFYWKRRSCFWSCISSQLERSLATPLQISPARLPVGTRRTLPANCSQPRAAAFNICPRKKLEKRNLCLCLPPSRGQVKHPEVNSPSLAAAQDQCYLKITKKE